MKKEKVNRSPLFYVGDKYKLISEIKSHFPQHIRCFVEPFVGGGSVFLNVSAEKFILNDLDSNVIAIHKFLSSQIGHEAEFFDAVFKIIDYYGLSCSCRRNDIPQELKLTFKKTYFAKFNKNGFCQLRNDFNTAHQKETILLYVLLIYGFNRMLRFNGKGDYNLPVGNVDFNQNTYNALMGYFNEVANKNVQWHNQDFRKFFKGLELSANDFVYLDPPYLITFSEYNKHWNEQAEKDLLKILDWFSEKNIKFAISNVTYYKGKENSTFLNWSDKYNVHSIKSNYISYHDNTNKTLNEVLVTNY